MYFTVSTSTNYSSVDGFELFDSLAIVDDDVNMDVQYLLKSLLLYSLGYTQKMELWVI